MNLSPSSDPTSTLLAVIQDPSLAALAANSPEWWEQVKREAHHHGLSAVLATLCGEYLPADQKAWQRGVVATHLASHNRLLRELKTIVSALDAEGIRSVVLKGPVLGERYLDPPFLKISGDLDILVDEANLQRACRCLEQSGLNEERHASPWWAWKRIAHHVTFTPSSQLKEGASVDLHFRLFWHHKPISGRDLLDRSELWSGARGLQVRVLNPVDEAIYLANHATRHFFVRLAWLYDALMVFRKLSMVERSQVLALARKAGKMTVLSAANRAAIEFFHEPLLADLPDFPDWQEFRRESSQVIEINDGMLWREKWHQRVLLRKLSLQLAGSPRDLLGLAEKHFIGPAIVLGNSLVQRIRS